MLSAVFFTILLVAGNTMAQSVRERTNELAVLKTLGFTHGQVLALVLAESCCIAVLGGLLGLALSWVLITVGGDPTRGQLPVFFFPGRDIALGVALTLVLGLVTGMLPAFQAHAPAHRRRAEEGLTMLNWLSQIAAVTALNLRTIGQRRGSSAAAVVGVAGVVAVFVAVLSIGEGFRHTLQSTGSPDTAIVLRTGSDSEMMSGLRRDDTRIIAEAPGVRRGARGPIASAELFVVVDLPKRSTGTDANVPLRGVQPAAFEVRDEVKIVEGRAFQPGRNEIIVGRAAAAEFAGLELGNRLRWGENEWRWSASSRPGARSPSRRSGATPGCCSPPTGAATPSRRSTPSSIRPRRSTASRTL